MPNISSLFGSYQKATDIDVPKTLTIRELKVEQIGKDQETKGVLYFEEEDEKPLILNRTNGEAIGELFGSDWDAWPGKQIEIYSTKVPLGSKMVPGIRVREAKGQSFVDEFVNGGESGQPKTKAAEKPTEKADAVDPELDDEIPY